MADEKRNPEPAAAAPSLSPDEMEELARSLGMIFSNSFLYGPAHGVTKQAAENGFAILNIALEKCSELVFTVNENELLINGSVVELKNPLTRMFATRLSGLEVSSFAITSGMSREKFGQLITIMNTKPDDLKKDGGFQAVVARSGMENVRAKRVVFQQVAEDDVVLSKTSAGVIDAMAASVSGQEEAAKAAAAAAALPPESHEQKTERIERQVTGILAFLKGDPSQPDPGKTPDGFKEVSSDPQKLGELILRAAVVRKESADIEGGESFAGLVVGCLGKAFNNMMKGEEARTQKGRKNIARTLMLLEKSLLDQMRQMSEGVSEEDLKTVSDKVEEMNDELKMDGLADEYAKKRQAIDAQEKRILRYIKSKGAEHIEETDLKNRLMDGGLSMDGWNELLVKSGVGALADGMGLSESAGGMGAIGHLASLLTNLERNLEKLQSEPGVAGKTSPELTATIQQIEGEVKQATEKTNQKIATLVEEVRKDEKAEKDAAAGGKVPVDGHAGMTKKKLIELLAEIVQELCQPVAVINCAVDSVRSEGLGTITPAQGEMLSLAQESSNRLQVLIDRLLEIAGVPMEMTPDQAIQDSLYKEK